ncbi:MAG: U32 family peptidase [Methanomicrobiales archaeon]|nr:U32 family peptidase [Methanomicrobiales archaeon]
MKRPIPELLAPAGSWEALLAAIGAGADAVYLGGRRFNARRLAKNFGPEELERAVAYSHERGVRVYVTVNTLIRERELQEAIEYLLWLYEIGVDAVLVQDAGLARLARDTVPRLPLHASTQMTVHNAEGVEHLAREGFRRVVLARELGSEEIEEIASRSRDLGIGLEIFIHGALCFSFSGQCLLSTCMGGRSANRGVCAQPCRKRYTLVKGAADEFGRMSAERQAMSDTAHLLSTRDLCTFGWLDSIVRLPVESLKIEGRMKSPEYVAVVVDVYRRALDLLGEGDWRPDPVEECRLALAFNRLFTRGLIFGARDEEMLSPETPGHRGLKIGTSQSRTRRQDLLRIRLIRELMPVKGDAIAFRTADGKTAGGFILSRAPLRRGGEISVRVPCDIPENAEISIMRSSSLEQRAREIMARSVSSRVPLMLKMNAFLDAEQYLVLRGTVCQPGRTPLSVSVKSNIPFQSARGRPLAAVDMKKHLCRGIHPPFSLTDCRIEYPGGLFMPLSALNENRRRFLMEALSAVTASYRPDETEIQGCRDQLDRFRRYAPLRIAHSIQMDRPPKLGVIVDDLQSARESFMHGADTIYYELETGDAIRKANPRAGSVVPAPEDLRSLGDICEDCHASGKSLFWKWPRICRQPFIDRAVLLATDTSSPVLDGFMVENAGAAVALKRYGLKQPIHGYSGLNVWNSWSVAEYSELFGLLTLSPELSLREIEHMMQMRRPGWPEIGMQVQGNLEAMVSEICIPASLGLCREGGCGDGDSGVWALRDEQNCLFPIRMGSSCHTHIFNSVETCLIDLIPEFFRCGIDTFILDARGRGSVYSGRICEIYSSAIEAVMEYGVRARDEILSLKEGIREMARGGITMGPLLTGLREEDHQ